MVEETGNRKVGNEVSQCYLPFYMFIVIIHHFFLNFALKQHIVLFLFSSFLFFFPLSLSHVGKGLNETV